MYDPIKIKPLFQSLYKLKPYDLESFNVEKYIDAPMLPKNQMVFAPIPHYDAKSEPRLKGRLKKPLGRPIPKAKPKPKYKNPNVYTPEELERMKISLGITDEESPREDIYTVIYAFIHEHEGYVAVIKDDFQITTEVKSKSLEGLAKEVSKIVVDEDYIEDNKFVDIRNEIYPDNEGLDLRILEPSEMKAYDTFYEQYTEIYADKLEKEIKEWEEKEKLENDIHN